MNRRAGLHWTSRRGARGRALWCALVTLGMVGSPLGYAAPPDDRGQGRDHAAEQRATQVEQRAAQAEARAEQQTAQADQRAAQAAEVATRRVEQATAQAEQRTAQAAQRAEQTLQRAEVRATQALEQAQRASEQRSDASAARSERMVGARESRGRADRPTERLQLAQAHVHDLVQSLNKLEHARWSQNPHDTRGQGNLGKVNMQDPFGFDQESDREGQDRGRPIRGVAPIPEPIPEPDPVPVSAPLPGSTPLPESTLADQVTVDFSSLEAYEDWLWQWYQSTVSSYDTLPDSYKSTTTYDQWQAMWYDHFFKRTDTYTGLIINQAETMDYTLQFTGTGTYEITTQLVSTEDYNSDYYQYDWKTGRWTVEPVQYAAGEVILRQSQEVTLDGTSGTFSYSYDLSDELMGNDDMLAQLQVVVTDTSTGESTTLSYDKSLYLYRCPYGIVYDATTGEPVAGATVTVHALDGSIIPLDKAANPNASNPQTTDATGRYNCKLAINKQYYLSVKAPGYAEYTSKVFSERWSIVREDVGLTRATAEPSVTPLPSVMGELLAPATGSAVTAGAMRRMP